MDDILKRLGNVESLVSELRTQVAGILALIPQLATKADVADLKAAVAIIPHLATKADIAIIPHLATKADVADVRAALAHIETAVINGSSLLC